MCAVTRGILGPSVHAAQNTSQRSSSDGNRAAQRTNLPCCFFTLNSGGEASCPCTLPSVVPPPPPFCSFVSFALGWLQLLDWEPQELPAKTQWIVQAFRLPWCKVCSVSTPCHLSMEKALQCAVLILFPQFLTGAI